MSACSGGSTGAASGLEAQGRGGTASAGSSGTGAAGAGGVLAGAGAGGGAAASAGGHGPSITLTGGTNGGELSGSAGEGEVCATVSASATLEPVFLAFAFDVSGSMGKGDYPWHDATLKWDPVVAATRAFFEDPASSGLSASLTAFPIDAGDDERCDSASYESPDVSMRALPSQAFGEALDAIRAEDWRGGTPTLAVVEGVQAAIGEYRATHPGHYVLVLVTDGYPQGCDDNDIDLVESAVEKMAGDVPTYVIGVKNPPLTDDDGDMAPDTVSNLTGVAEAGGTKSAFIIDTGDPASTTAAFAAAVDQIRGVQVSCTLEIPSAPNHRTFEKDHVRLSYTSAGNVSELAYDPTCAGDNGWHYDDVAAPEAVVLCPTTCASVQADASAKLDVGFTCEAVIQVR